MLYNHYLLMKSFTLAFRQHHHRTTSVFFFLRCKLYLNKNSFILINTLIMMIFETLSSAESYASSSMRMLECPGLESSAADMHLGPSRAHITLDSTPGKSRFLRRLDFSNSLLITKIDSLETNTSANSTKDEVSVIADDQVANLTTPAQEQKATALQRVKGLFETDPIRPPTEIIEAVLRPSCLTLDELDGEKKIPADKLIKLSALYDVSFMSRQALIRYLIGRAALFVPIGDSDENSSGETRKKDYFVRLLDPSLLREGVVEIASFLTTAEEFFFNAMRFESPSGQAQDLDNNNEDAAAAATTNGGENKDKTLEAERLATKVKEHFSSAQFPIIYSIAWQYMTCTSNLDEPNETKFPQHETFNLKRIVPLLATHIVTKPGALTKQSLSELWEGCTADYWFLRQDPYYSSETHLGEGYLYGYFAQTELKGVVVAPHTTMPNQIVARLIKLFKMSSKWEKQQLFAYLLPIADSLKALNKLIGTRCREVKDGTNSYYYLI